MNNRAPLTRDGRRIMEWQELPRVAFARSIIAATEDPRQTVYRIKRTAYREEHAERDYRKTD